jgi:outer membrane lipoprotein-sorting protein
MMRVTLFISMMTTALAALAASDSTAPSERLRAAQNAEERLTLCATLNTATFSQQTPASSQVVVCRKSGACRWEYQAPALNGLVMIEKGDAVMRLDPVQKVASVGCARREAGAFDLLLKNYTVTAERTEPIIGRPADVLVVKHREPGRPAKKVWVDRATSLILRTEYYDCEGRLATLTFYTDIAWNPQLDDGLFEIPDGWKKVALEDDAAKHWTRESLSKEVAFNVREPATLPAGFALDGFHLYHCRCGAASAHLRYVDGLNSVSVFERSTQCPDRGRGRGFGWGKGRGGGRNCQLLANQPGRMFVRQVGGLSFILIGDLPEAELARIADSIK